MKILAINPGSTSTKVSYYVDGEIIKEQGISHSTEELQKFQNVVDQMEFRRDILLAFMKKEGIDPKELDAVAGRGGSLPPVSSGAYEVNDDMIYYLKNVTQIEHPSNLGAILAHEIKEQGSEKTIALIYDPVSVDEFEEVARISGLKGIERKSIGHALNMRAVAMKVAREEGLDYQHSTLIVAHLGGGNTISIHHKGKMIDLISDDEGPFSTERTGGLPLKYLMPLCYEHTLKEMLRLYKREGGYQWFSRSDRFDWWGSLFKDRRNRIRKTGRFYRTNRSSTRGTRNDRFIKRRRTGCTRRRRNEGICQSKRLNNSIICF